MKNIFRVPNVFIVIIFGAIIALFFLHKSKEVGSEWYKHHPEEMEKSWSLCNETNNINTTNCRNVSEAHFQLHQAGVKDIYDTPSPSFSNYH
jgi:hypothetical protein